MDRIESTMEQIGAQKRKHSSTEQRKTNRSDLATTVIVGDRLDNHLLEAAGPHTEKALLTGGQEQNETATKEKTGK